MTDLTTEQRAELRRLHEAAGGFAWACTENTFHRPDAPDWDEDNDDVAGEMYGAFANEQAALAAAAVNALPALLDASDERDHLRARLAEADKALIEARDRFCGDEDDDLYWSWFNRHEDTVFKRITREAKATASAHDSRQDEPCPVCDKFPEDEGGLNDTGGCTCATGKREARHV